jgi:hypothetical protein
VLLALPEQPVLLALPDLLDRLAQLALSDLLDLRVNKVFLALQDLQVKMETASTMANHVASSMSKTMQPNLVLFSGLTKARTCCFSASKPFHKHSHQAA